MNSFEYKNQQIHQKNPWTSLFLLVMLFLAANIFGQLLASAIAVFATGVDYKDITKLFEPPFTAKSKQFLYMAQGIGHFLSFTVFGLFYIKILDQENLKSYFNRKSLSASGILLVIFMTFSFMLFNSIVIEWNMNFQFPDFLKDFELWARAMEDRLLELTGAMSTYANVGEMLVAMLVIGILPAIGEELIFRGLLQKKLVTAIKAPHAAIWITAIIFGVFHLQFFGVVPRILLGALFGYIYYYSGNIWYPIVAHFINNGLAVLVMYIGPRYIEDWNPQEIDSSIPPLFSLAALAMSAFLFYLFIKQIKLKKD
jgi:hypothetical protein